MQRSPSIKVYLAIFFASLYLLSPLKDEILEISHGLSHKMAETLVRLQQHQHSHTHSISHSHPHSHNKSENTTHSDSHQHEMLEFITTVLEVPDEKQKQAESTKDKYDKHLVQYSDEVDKFLESTENKKITYLLKNYSLSIGLLNPPPEFNSLNT